MDTTQKPAKGDFDKFRDDWQTAVLEYPVKGAEQTLTCAEKCVLIRLSHYLNRSSGIAWPTATRLAAESGVSESVGKRALQKAEKFGFLATVEKGTGGAAGSVNRASKRRLFIPPKPENLGHVETGKSNKGVGSDTVKGVGSDRKGVGSGYLTSYRTPDDRTPYIEVHASANSQEKLEPVDRLERYIKKVFPGTTAKQIRSWVNETTDSFQANHGKPGNAEELIGVWKRTHGPTGKHNRSKLPQGDLFDGFPSWDDVPVDDALWEL